MTTNKEANNNNITPIARDLQSLQAGPECCMCGDYGVSNELFQCRVCQFRSQHSYCSNLYPKAESYQACNWCLSQKDDKDTSQNSSNISSSSNKTNGQEDDSKNKNNNRVLRSQRSNLQLQQQQQQQQLYKHFKRQNSSPPEMSSLPASPSPSTPMTRKGIITNEDIEEKRLLKRAKSEIERTNNNKNTVMIRKPVYRNKVRRYKLLDEVSC